MKKRSTSVYFSIEQDAEINKALGAGLSPNRPQLVKDAIAAFIKNGKVAAEPRYDIIPDRDIMAESVEGALGDLKAAVDGVADDVFVSKKVFK